MANRYWVGGTGTWNTSTTTNWATASGGAGGASAPTAADDVFIDGNSGTGTITTSAALARSLNCTGYTGTLTLANSGTTLTLGDGTAGASNAALTIASGMTLTIAGSATAIIFASTSTTQQTITTNGKTLGQMTFNGVGGSWILSDNTTATTVTLTNGTLNTNGKTCTWATLSSSNSNVRTLTLGASTITLSSATPVVFTTPTNLTFTSGTSTITCTGAGGTFQGGGLTFYNVTMSGGGTMTFAGANTFNNNLTFTGNATKTDNITLSANLTVSGTFTCTGNSVTNRFYLQSNIRGASRTVTTAAFSVANADFSDITAAGAGGTWTGTSLGDALGNSNITFPASTTRYAVTAGNWSSTAVWSATSGGSTGASVPLPQDAVVLNASSGAGTYTVDMPRVGATITMTGFTRTLGGSTATSCYGSLTLASGMTFSYSSTWTLAGRGNHTITTAGKTMAGLTEDAVGGTYTQQDAITCSGTWTQNFGTWTTQNFNITSLNWYSTLAGPPATRTFNGGTSTITITNTSATTVATVTPTGLTWNVSPGFNFTIANTSSNTRIFGLNAVDTGPTTLNYTVAGSTGQLSITGGGKIGTLNFSDANNARTLALAAGNITTFENFNVQGTSGNLMSIISLTSGTAAQIELLKAPPTVNYLSIKDIYSNVPYKFYAGANSTDVSGNTNIIFTAPVTQPYMVQRVEGTGAGTSSTITFNYGMSATAGNLLMVIFSSRTNAPGTVTPPAGFTLVDNNASGTSANLYIFTKTAVGGETSATITNTTSASVTDLRMYEYAPTAGLSLSRDVKDKNNSTGGTTSLSTGSGVSNTTTSAIVIGVWASNGGQGAQTSLTAGYQADGSSSASTTIRSAVLPVTATATRTVTYGWTTSRNASSQLLVFKNAVGGRTKVKISGTFVVKPSKVKISGTFSDKAPKTKVGGSFT